mgnify:CR=1 FL=1
MARVRPFRAWTYSRSSADVSNLAAPPYDVISPEQRDRLALHLGSVLDALEDHDDVQSVSSNADIPDEKWNNWRWQLSNRINTVEEFEKVLPLTDSERKALSAANLFIARRYSSIL